MGAQPRAVDAAPARAPGYSFLSIVERVEDPNVGRDLDGIAWDPEGCLAVPPRAIPCSTSVAGFADDLPTLPAQQEADPILLWYAETCTTLGYRARDWVGRVRRGLTATESYQLAQEVWDGAIADAANLVNRWLAGDPAWSNRVTSVGSPLAADLCLGRIETALGKTLNGQRGMIHVTPQVLSWLYTAGTIRREGALWLTAMDNVVVSDAGYHTGNGPATASLGNPATSTQFMYATPMMRVRLGPVITFPESPDDVAAVTRNTNDITVYAARHAIVEWNHCTHLAAEVNLATPNTQMSDAS